MRKPIKTSLLCMAMGAVPGAVLAQDSGITLGIDVGRAEARNICDDAIDCESDDSAARFSVGYNFNQVLGLEVGYSSFGTLVDSDDDAFAVKQDANAWTLSVLGNLPIGERFGIYGRAGAARFDNDTKGTVQGLPVRGDNKTKPYFGAGVKFGLTDNFALRAEYQRYKDLANIDNTSKDDVDAWSGGVLFTF